MTDFGGIETEKCEGIYVLTSTKGPTKVRLELDEGAKGKDGNWVDPNALRRWGIRPRKNENPTTYVSRLHPNSPYTAEEIVTLTIVLQPADVRITIKARVFPEDGGVQNWSELVIGNEDINKFGIRELLEATEAVFTPAKPADEVLNLLDKHLAEGAKLELMGGILPDVESRLPSEDGVEADSWVNQLCCETLPVGSPMRKKFIDLLEEFSDVVTDQLNGSKAKVVPMKVDLKPGEFFQGVRARRYSKDKKQVIRAWLDKMLKAGVIEHSPSPTTSPLLVVQDPSGKMRVTQDVSQLNKLMRHVHGSIPEIKAIVEKIGAMKFKGIFDLISAYHQMPAAAEMRELWAFSTPFGAYQYTDRLPMGDKNVSQHSSAKRIEKTWNKKTQTHEL